MSLGHAAFLGIGAYVTVLASGDSGALARAGCCRSAIGAAAAYALFVGALSLRTRGVYFIMVTLAFAQMAYFVFHDTKLGGGSDGIFLYVKPVLAIGGDDAARPRRARRRSTTRCSRALVATYALLALLLALALRPCARRHPRQRAAHARGRLRDLRATSSPRSSIAGALAGLAGFLLAVKDGAVNPELLSLARVGRGAADADPRRHRQPARRGDRRGRVHAAEGAVPVARRCSARSPSHWQLTLGLTIIAFVALLPQGLIGLGARCAACGWRRAARIAMSALPTSAAAAACVAAARRSA